MLYLKKLVSFRKRPAERSRSFGLARSFGKAAISGSGIAALLVLCLTLALVEALLHKRPLVGAHASNAETAAAASTIQPPQQPSGLSRQRKGFNAAISELKSGANQNQRLAAYYKRVIRRTGGQAADAEAATSVQAPVLDQKPDSPSLSPATTTVGSDLERSAAPAQATSHVASAVTSVAAGLQSASDDGKDAEHGQASLSEVRGEPASSITGGSGLVAGDMKFDLNPAIEHWVRYYTQSPGGRATMQQGLNRCENYLDSSRAEFRESGLPEDLVWVAQVESVWKQGAKSPVAAGGIWQFMPSTATDYGLSVKSPDDERFDPAKETRAAATYLRDLHTLFGSWELALAAYNCGEPRLMEAIVKYGQPDFWALCDRHLLPNETSNYVPKILAAIKVASAPDTYSFTVEPAQSASHADAQALTASSGLANTR